MGQREIIPCGSGVERVHLFFFQNAFLRVSHVRARARAGTATQKTNLKSQMRPARRAYTFGDVESARPRAAFHPFLRAVAGSRVPRLPRSRGTGRARGSVVSWRGSCVCAARFLTGTNALTVKRRRSRFARLCATNLQLSSSKSARWARVRGERRSRRIRKRRKMQNRNTESAPLALLGIYEFRIMSSICNRQNNFSLARDPIGWRLPALFVCSFTLS
jgi:hypothetical protein